MKFILIAFLTLMPQSNILKGRTLWNRWGSNMGIPIHILFILRFVITNHKNTRVTVAKRIEARLTKKITKKSCTWPPYRIRYFEFWNSDFAFGISDLTKLLNKSFQTDLSTLMALFKYEKLKNDYDFFIFPSIFNPIFYNICEIRYYNSVHFEVLVLSFNLRGRRPL